MIKPRKRDVRDGIGDKQMQEIADITGIKPSNMARFKSSSRVPMLVVLEKYANPLENILK